MAKKRTKQGRPELTVASEKPKVINAYNLFLGGKVDALKNPRLIRLLEAIRSLKGLRPINVPSLHLLELPKLFPEDSARFHEVRHGNPKLLDPDPPEVARKKLCDWVFKAVAENDTDFFDELAFVAKEVKHNDVRELEYSCLLYWGDIFPELPTRSEAMAGVRTRLERISGRAYWTEDMIRSRLKKAQDETRRRAAIAKAKKMPPSRSKKDFTDVEVREEANKRKLQLLTMDELRRAASRVGCEFQHGSRKL